MRKTETDIARKPLESFEVLFGHGGAGTGDHIGNAGLVAGDDVHITFYHNRETGLADGFFGQVQAKDLSALIISDCLRGIDVFGRVRLSLP